MTIFYTLSDPFNTDSSLQQPDIIHLQRELVIWGNMSFFLDGVSSKKYISFEKCV